MNKHSDDGTNQHTREDDSEIRSQVIQQKLLDAQTPGFQAEFDPDEADLLGAFKEDALSEADALDSSIDHSDGGGL